ncbi:uncharacterized protein LOC116159581 [Photinus pyralis]|uniref:uncharacterized protein LOC116159581 n=1 Tax=Photinus pyralis TaxID=7054 RepID=UPI0012676454|nr:uncharacterized protein LOC116159581 [Photinus pyralis]
MSYRVSQLKPFSVVSLDYAGPVMITLGKTRKPKILKAYIYIFVCCAVKAIHIELASDLSSDSFIAAFRRFTARRGRCSEIFSDQGTNFIGANRQFIELAQQAATKLNLNWNFNPPGAPHFNGLSEAGVKAVKTHLKRVIGTQILTYEELYTFLTQVEALLNSRPLCAISQDPNDLQALTPSHFLNLEPLNSVIPDPDLSHIKLNRLNRWQLLQRMHHDFWKRWHLEYLHTLQQRSKWYNKTTNIRENALVLIKDEQKTPLFWPLGRIIEVHPGTDGVVRVATVKTSHGIYKRPVVKLCPLPIQ